MLPGSFSLATSTSLKSKYILLEVAMELTAVYRCVAALDIHQSKLTVCLLYENEFGELLTEVKEFGGFKKDRNAMAQWVASFKPDLVVMESTGIYWKSPYAALERYGLKIWVVNARHVKQVPGRKTDIADAHWLAILARNGLLRGGFVPPVQFRELRVVSRQMQKMTGILSGEKNRLHKILSDTGIRLGVVVSDLHGKSARAMIKGLLAGETPQQVLRHASNKLKATEEELLEALEGDISPSHYFVLSEVMAHIEQLEQRIITFQQFLLQGLAEYTPILQSLQTIPGIDLTSAAMLLVEIGDDMEAFGSPEKLASWAGVCPGNNESAGKRKSRTARKGNPYVRRILCEAANAARRTRCNLQEKFKGIMLRRGKKRAIFAIAHKLLKTVYLLIERSDYYREANRDYEALSVQRNAPRWIKKLKQFGYIAA
jgi:transposase